MVELLNGYRPANLEEALRIRAEKSPVPYAGGTDLCVENRKGVSYLFIGDLPELKNISDDGACISIGAAVTFREALKSDILPEIMKEAISRIGSPAIRNAGTFGGNLGNGSGKADTVSVGIAMDAKIVLRSVKGQRVIPAEEFYLGNKKTVLESDELITEVLLPKRNTENYYYKKVAGRNALAISRISIAGLFDEADGRICQFAVALGAVSDTVLRFRDIESRLIGKTKEEAALLKEDVIREYIGRMDLPEDRVSIEYRKKVCANLLNDFLGSNGI